MTTKDSLGDRMKEYEDISRIYLTRRMPVIIRIDGCHFHTFTKRMHRPFDDILIKSMQETAKYLCENIMGCKLAYTQSDEISLLLTDDDTITTQAWFDKNLQKLCSVSASMATMAFNRAFERCISDFSSLHTVEEISAEGYSIGFDSIHNENMYGIYNEKLASGAYFDARAFILPKEEVCNYFIWRQQDATRNSIQMVGQASFSHKQLQGKSCNDIQDMLMENEGYNWNNLEPVYKRGSCVVKEQYGIAYIDSNKNVIRSRWKIDNEIPVFTQDRNYIESKLITRNDDVK